MSYQKILAAKNLAGKSLTGIRSPRESVVRDLLEGGLLAINFLTVLMKENSTPVFPSPVHHQTGSINAGP